MFSIFSRSAIAVSFIIFVIFSSISAKAFVKTKTVAITQIVAHDSLDQVREGIIAALKEQYSQQINIELSNANGSIITATQIATRLASRKPDLIIAIATPSAQTVVKAVQGSDIPVLFATISDPIGAKLVKNLEHPEGMITGTRNFSPIKEQLLIAKEIVPNLQKLGIVFSLSEANSTFMVNNIHDEAKKLGIKVMAKGITNTAEVKLAAEGLVKKVDAFFLIQDNAVASSLPALIKTANQHQIPVIASYVEAIAHGAIAGLALDEYNIGNQTGKMAIKILEGVKPSNLPVEDPDKLQLVINKKAAKELGISFSEIVMLKANRLE